MQADLFRISRLEVDDFYQNFSFYYSVSFEDGTTKSFVEHVTFPEVNIDLSDRKKEDLMAAARAYHIVAGTSYYKMYCPARIEVMGGLTEDEAVFWATVYIKGLSEFWYKNQLDFRNALSFGPIIPSDSSRRHCEETEATRQSRLDEIASPDEQVRNDKLTSDRRALVAVSGGKDSIVATELVKKTGMEMGLFTVNASTMMQESAKAIGGKHIQLIRRLDPQVIELSKSGEVYNGHIPITFINTFLAVMTAILYGYDYVVFGNERSADYGNVEYLGLMINHQMSKSQEFEKLMADYVQEYVRPDLRVFSILRPFYEIEIVRQFAAMPHYWHSFTSCNSNYKLNKENTGEFEWCGQCPKCAFIFLLLAAFLKKDDVIAIFGENLFDRAELEHIFAELWGEDIKPFECVGTPEEVQVAWWMIHEKGEYAGSKIYEMYKPKIESLASEIEDLKKEVFSYGSDDLMPGVFKRVARPL